MKFAYLFVACFSVLSAGASYSPFVERWPTHNADGLKPIVAKLPIKETYDGFNGLGQLTHGDPVPVGPSQDEFSLAWNAQHQPEHHTGPHAKASATAPQPFPEYLVFALSAHQNALLPTAHSLRIRTTSGTQHFTALRSASWLAVSPTSGTASTQGATLTVSVDKAAATAEHSKQGATNSGSLLAYVDVKFGNGVNTSVPVFVVFPPSSSGVQSLRSFDAASRIQRVVLPSQQVLDYTRNPSGQVTSSCHYVHGGSETCSTYTYTPSGLNTGGRQGSMETILKRDVLGHLYAENIPAYAKYFFGYERDNMGRVTEMKYVNGVTCKYAYDADSRPTIATFQFKTASYKVQFYYHPVSSGGQLSEIRYNGGARTTYEYDAVFGLVSKIRHLSGSGHVLAQELLTYDKVGRVHTRELCRPHCVTTTYTYDAAGRVTHAASSNGAYETFAYDATGNRIKWIDRAAGHSASTLAFTYDEYNRVTRASNGQTMSYDAEGRITRRGSYHYYYHAPGKGHMSEVKYGRTTKVTYKFDALGRRVDRSGTVHMFLTGDHHKGSPLGRSSRRVLEMRSMRVSRTYLYAGGRLVGVVQPGKAIEWVMQDARGSVAHLVNHAGTALTASYHYSVFGRDTLTNHNSVYASSLPFRYNSLPKDPYTGLYHMHAREYDPWLGRFLSADVYPGKAAKPCTLHKYSFVCNDPVNYHDPSGHFLKTIERGLDDVGDGVKDLGEGAKDVADDAGHDVARASEYTYHHAVVPVYKHVVVPVVSDGAGVLTAAGLEALVGTEAASSTVDGPAGVALAIGTQSVVGSASSTVEANVRSLLEGHGFASRDEDLKAAGTGAVLGPIGNKLVESTGVEKPVGDLIGKAYTHVVGKDLTSDFARDIATKSTVDLPLGYLKDKTVDGLMHLGGIDGDRTESQDSNNAPIPGLTEGFQGGTLHDRDTGLTIMHNGANSPCGGGRRRLLSTELVDSYAANSRHPRAYNTTAWDLRVAVDSVLTGPAPGVSIDPPILNNSMPIRYVGKVANSRMGWILYEADRTLKILTLGRDPLTGQRVSSRVPGYKNMITRRLEMGCSDGHDSHWTRMWFAPKLIQVSRSVSSSGLAGGAFQEVSMQLLTQSRLQESETNATIISDPPAEAFAKHFNEHFEDFAAEFPIIAQLNRLGHVIAGAKWLLNGHMPLDLVTVTTMGAAEPPLEQPNPTRTPITAAYGMALQVHNCSQGRCVRTCRQYIKGGVTYQPPTSYNTDPSAAFAHSVMSSRPSEESLRWSYTTPPCRRLRRLLSLHNNAEASSTEEYDDEELSSSAQPMSIAVATAFGRRRKAGALHFHEVDVVAPTAGKCALQLARYYNSFHDRTSSLGRKGWSLEPAELRLSSAAMNFTFGQHTPPHIRSGRRTVYYVNRMTGQAAEQELTLFSLTPQDELFYKSALQPTLQMLSRPDGTYVVRASGGVQMTFDVNGRLTQCADANKHVVTYVRSSTGQLTSIRSASHSITLQYSSGRLSRAFSSLSTSQHVSYTYTGQMLSSVTRPGGYAHHYTYSSSHMLTKVTNAHGVSLLSAAYDIFNRVMTSTASGLPARTLSYSLAARQAKVAQAGETPTHTVRYNDVYAPVLSENAHRARARYGYDNTSALMSVGVEHAAHLNLVFARDSLGRTTEVRRGSAVTKFVWWNTNRLAAIALPGQSHYRGFFYDKAGNLLKSCTYTEVVLKSGKISGLRYNPSRCVVYEYSGGRLSGWTNPMGHKFSVSSEADGRVTSVRTPLGVSTSVQYNSHAQVSGASYGSHSASLSFDSSQRLSGIDVAGVRRYSVTYNSEGLPSVVENAYNQKTTVDVSSTGQLRSLREPTGAQTFMHYSKGSLSSITQANGLHWTYQYDQLGHSIATWASHGSAKATASDTAGHTDEADDVTTSPTPSPTTATPYTPVLQFPPNSTASASSDDLLLDGAASSSAQQLSWSSPAVAAAYTHRVYICTSAADAAALASSCIVKTLQLSAEDFELTHLSVQLSFDTVFYWTVTSLPDGAPSGTPPTRSGVSSFRSRALPAPHLFVSPLPVTSDSTPHFMWANVSGATHYRLQVATQLSVFATNASANVTFTLNFEVTAANYQTVHALPDGLLYWRVYALQRSAQGFILAQSVPSNIISFRVMTSPPATPVLAPAQVLSGLSHPVLAWTMPSQGGNASAPLPDDVQDFHIIIKDSTGTVVVDTMSPQEHVNLVESLPDGTYTWQVAAVDIALNESPAATGTLVIDTAPPPGLPLDNLQLVTDGSSFVRLSLKLNTSLLHGSGAGRVVSFNVYRSQQSFASVATLAPLATVTYQAQSTLFEYTDNSVPSSETGYFYAVVAVDDVGMHVYRVAPRYIFVSSAPRLVDALVHPQPLTIGEDITFQLKWDQVHAVAALQLLVCLRAGLSTGRTAGQDFSCVGGSATTIGSAHTNSTARVGSVDVVLGSQHLDDRLAQPTLTFHAYACDLDHGHCSAAVSKSVAVQVLATLDHINITGTSKSANTSSGVHQAAEGDEVAFHSSISIVTGHSFAAMYVCREPSADSAGCTTASATVCTTSFVSVGAVGNTHSAAAQMRCVHTLGSADRAAGSGTSTSFYTFVFHRDGQAAVASPMSVAVQVTPAKPHHRSPALSAGAVGGVVAACVVVVLGAAVVVLRVRRTQKTDSVQSPEQSTEYVELSADAEL